MPPDLLEKLITSSPVAVVLLIALCMFLRHMNTISARHQKCLADRDRVLGAITSKLTKSLDSNSRSMDRNTAATERLESSVSTLKKKP